MILKISSELFQSLENESVICLSGAILPYNRNFITVLILYLIRVVLVVENSRLDRGFFSLLTN